MLKQKIISLVAKETNLKKEQISPIIEIPPDSKLGDYAFPCFILAKKLKKSPIEIAKQLQDKIKPTSIIEKIHAAGPYLNFYINKEKFAEIIINPILKKQKYKKRNKTILIESPGPNTNKPLHLGHLRNMSLGISLSNTLKYVGYKVKNIDIVNDRGIHICKSMLAYQKWGNNKQPDKKPDHFVGDFYVLYSKKLKENPSLEQETKLLLKKWEEKDKKTISLWKKMNNWAIKGIQQTYNTFGMHIDKTYFESDHYKKGKEMILNAYKKNIFKKDDSGAIFIDFGKELGKKILLRSDSTSVYITQDIYLAKERYNDFKMDKMVYIVGSDQIYHFKVLFKILQLFKYPFAKSCYHLAYGMVYLPEGKMKSREGQKADADNIITETISLAKKEIQKRHKSISKKELGERSKVIALAAIKFYLLKYDPLKDFVYNPQESISFEGETGPYIQYAHARICSIFKKTELPVKANLSLLKEELEQKVIKQLSYFPQIVEQAAAKYKPSLIANYLIELTQSFNKFYDTLPILKSEKEIKNARLYLIQAAQYILKTGLHLLGIDSPESM